MIPEFGLILNHPASLLLMILGLDLLFGDPVYRFHPVRMLGHLLTFYENGIRNRGWNGKAGGSLLVFLLLISAWGMHEIIIFLLSAFHWTLVLGWNVFLGWSLFALMDLIRHAERVALSLEQNDTTASIQHVQMLVGRDTRNMDLSACGRATVESISENFNDGVVAPICFFLLFGIPGMLIFKVINTLDSMVGYRNEKYFHFGWLGAKLDDVCGWIPARISWLLLSLYASFHPNYSGKLAFKTGLKEHSKLSSPNAGWSEATVAGALKIRLCGPIWRDGKLAQNYWLGSDSWPEGANAKHIRQANQLILKATFLGIALSIWVILVADFI